MYMFVCSILAFFVVKFDLIQGKGILCYCVIYIEFIVDQCRLSIFTMPK